MTLSARTTITVKRDDGTGGFAVVFSVYATAHSSTYRWRDGGSCRCDTLTLEESVKSVRKRVERKASPWGFSVHWRAGRDGKQLRRFDHEGPGPDLSLLVTAIRDPGEEYERRTSAPTILEGFRFVEDSLAQEFGPGFFAVEGTFEGLLLQLPDDGPRRASGAMANPW